VLVDSGKRAKGEIVWTYNPTIRDELVKRGVWVDSGKRDPQTGEIIWTCVDAPLGARRIFRTARRVVGC
jgi:hypothetical protein